jgi:hypothetical protein
MWPCPGHGSVTTDETIETKHNISRKNFLPIKITYGFVKPPKTSSDPDDAPVRVVLYLGYGAPQSATAPPQTDRSVTIM